MKPYTTDKHVGKKKFDKKKLNKRNGVISSTETSALEAKNANRSRKKAIRQEGKKKIGYLFDNDFYNDYGPNNFNMAEKH